VNSLSVIIPSRNEEQNIPYLIEDINNFIRENNEIDLTFIIVDDFSTDNSVEIYKKYTEDNDNLKLLTLNKQVGPMGAEIVGFDNAFSEFITILPADMQTKVHSLNAFIEICDNFDIIWSFRQKRRDSLARKIISKFYNSIVIFFLNIYPKDLHSVFFMKTEIYQKYKKQLIGDSAFFHLKLAYLAKNYNLNQTEVPIEHYPRQFGEAQGVNFKQVLLIIKDFYRLLIVIRRISRQ
tara:strand:+ start:116 stop:823 length:708 start_codon:yes stop_codon:yes gene_type:complete